MLRQGPARQARVEPSPQGEVVAIMQPHRAVRGLQLHKRQQRGGVGLQQEEAFRDEDEGIIHL